MTHHDTVVSFKVRLWETLSQGVCHHEICVQSHQLNQINQTQFVDVVSTIIPDKIFHLRYRDIVGSLGYLVNMVCTIPTTRSHCFGSARPPISSRHLCTGHQVPLWCFQSGPVLGLGRCRLDPRVILKQSHTGYVLIPNGGPISWKSRRKLKQHLSWLWRQSRLYRYVCRPSM